MRLNTLILFFAFVFTTCFSQPAFNKKDAFVNGLYFFESGDYKESLYNFLQIYEIDSANANINFKIAMCYFNISGQELKSIPFLIRASRNISDKYQEYSLQCRTAPLHTLFYLGKAYRLNGQIDKALETIKRFTDSPYFLEYNPEIVNREINTCNTARTLMNSPIKINYTNLDTPINDETDNSKAIISADGNSIVYISNLKLYDAIMYSVKVNGQWTTPKNISSWIGSDGNFYPSSLSADGKELYLVKTVIKGTSDIYISKLIDTSWTKAEALNININTKANETHACISPDGQTLYFTSDIKGFGKSDIFYSTKDPKTNDWGKAINMGKTINTSENESTPFITNNGNLLFFSSEGHYNMGESDVFYSIKQTDGKWSEPKNLGYPINTTTNNVFFSPINNGNAALIYKNSPDGYGGLDIYQIELPFEPFLSIK